MASAAPAPGFCHLFGDIVRKSQASARVDKRSASLALTCERTPISVRESKSTPSRQKRDRSPNVTGSARRTSISFVTDATRNCPVEFNCPEPAHGYCPKHDVRVFVRRPSCHSGCTRSEKVKKPAHAGRRENKLNAQCMSSLSMFLVQLERLFGLGSPAVFNW